MYRDDGVFEVIDRPHWLVTNVVMHFPDGASFATRITVTFEVAPGDRTLLTLLDEGYPTEEQRDRHEGGWPAFLDAFQRTLAGR